MLPTETLALARSTRVRLTDFIAVQSALPEGKSDMVLWDADLAGFGLRIRPEGKSWIVGFRPSGSGRSGSFKRMKIASVATMRSAVEARNLARIILGQIARGGDPLADRRASRERETLTLDVVLGRYAADLERRNYVNGAVVVKGLRSKLGRLVNQDVREIEGAPLIAIIEQLEKAGRAGAAKDFRSRARAFFGWTISKKLRADNPLAGFRRERATRADRVAKAEHGRALSDAEIAAVWLSADPETSLGRLWRFWLLTGCRRGEGAGLTWPMWNKEEGVLDLPAVFVKQGRGHIMPVAPQLQTILTACTRDARSDLLFPSARSGGVMSGWTQITDAMNKASGVDFKIHDLRRTFRTGLARLGVDETTAELAIGHARADLVQVYNRDRGLAELRPAFELWARHVETVARAEEARRVVAAGTGVFG